MEVSKTIMKVIVMSLSYQTSRYNQANILGLPVRFGFGLFL